MFDNKSDCLKASMQFHEIDYWSNSVFLTQNLLSTSVQYKTGDGYDCQLSTSSKKT